MGEIAVCGASHDRKPIARDGAGDERSRLAESVEYEGEFATEEAVRRAGGTGQYRAAVMTVVYLCQPAAIVPPVSGRA